MAIRRLRSLMWKSREKIYTNRKMDKSKDTPKRGILSQYVWKCVKTSVTQKRQIKEFCFGFKWEHSFKQWQVELTSVERAGPPAARRPARGAAHSSRDTSSMTAEPPHSKGLEASAVVALVRFWGLFMEGSAHSVMWKESTTWSFIFNVIPFL